MRCIVEIHDGNRVTKIPLPNRYLLFEQSLQNTTAVYRSTLPFKNVNIYLFKSPNWYLYTKIAFISALPWSSFLPLNIDHTVLKYQFCINDRIVFSHLPLYKLQDFTTASITMPAHQLIKTSALSFKNWNCFERARRISLVHLELVFCANRNCSIVSFKRLASRFLYVFLQNNQFRFAAVLINS